MSTAPVTISINVVDNNSTATLGKVESSVRAVGAAGTAASAQMGGMAAGFDQVGAAGTKMANDFRGASSTVIGASREMGIGVSRYFDAEIMEKFPGLITMVKSLGTAFFALGAIEIGAHIVEGLEHVYEKLFDVDKAIEDYRKKAAEAAQEKLFDIASLETATALLAQANRQVDELAAKKKAAGAEGKMGGLTQYGRANPEATGNMMVTDFDAYTPQDAEKQAASMLDAQKAAQRQAELEHQQRIEQIKLEQNNTLQGYAKRADEERTSNKLSEESVRWLQEQESLLNSQIIAYKELLNAQGDYVGASNQIVRDIGAYSTTNDVGFNTRHTDEAAETAAAKAAEQRRAGDAEDMRRQTDQEIAMHNEAINAGLQGEALYLSQRLQAIAEIKRKVSESQLDGSIGKKEIDDVDLRYHNAKMKRLEEEQEQTQKMVREAQIAGMTGLARIQAEGASRAGDIVAQAAKSGDPSQLPQRLAANDQRTQDQMAEATAEFYAKLRMMNDEWNGAQLQGYARIDSETIRHLDTLQKDYQKEFSQLAANDPARVQAGQAVAEMTTGAWANADRERERLHQETLIGLQKEETDAARALLSPWAAAQQQIIGQYNERLQKAQQERDAELAYFKSMEAQFPKYAQQINDARLSAEQDYQAKVQAARQLEAAQLQKETQQMRDELAGKLGSFFQDPMKFMEKQAESMMMKIIANWVMQLGDFQHNPALQMMFGMGPNVPAPGASSGGSGLMKMLGAGGHGASTTSLSAPATQLSSAGSTLGTAGSVLIAAAGDLSSAGSTLATAMGMGGFGGGGWSGGSTSGTGGVGMAGTAASSGDIGIPGIYSPGGSFSGGGAGSACPAKGTSTSR
jgi:hypothetical protein